MILKEAQHGHQHLGLGSSVAEVIGAEAGQRQQPVSPRFVSERDGERLQRNRYGVAVVWGWPDHRLY